jgi:hypothetical protein
MRETFEYIRKEWAVLRSAPGAFIGLAVVFFLSGAGAGSYYFAGQIAAMREQMVTKDGQVSRYRMALGIDPGSKGALVELTNEELQAKGFQSVAKLRELCGSTRRQVDALRVLLNEGKIDVKQWREGQLALNKDLADRFDQQQRADVLNIFNEILRRLDQKSIGAIARVSPSIIMGGGAPVPLIASMPSGSEMESILACELANSLDQSAKQLPVRPIKQHR